MNSGAGSQPIRPGSRPIRVGINARCFEEPHTRGLSRYAACLLRELSRRDDIDLVLFSTTPPHPNHLRDIRAEVVSFPGRETEWQDWLLPRHLRRAGIDLFHAPADRGLPLHSPCPGVVTVHDSYERAHWRQLFQSTKARLWYWKHEMANRLRADAFITVSDAAHRALATRRVVPAGGDVHAIHLAASGEFQPTRSPEDGAVLAKAGVTRPYLLYVGGYDPRKNVDLLVRAFDRLPSVSHQLVIVARQGSDYYALRDRWRSLDCADRLRCIEAPDEDLPALFRLAELFVNPSTWESFSLQTMEAMACGVPVLASDLPAIREITGGAAVLFDPSDVAGLANRITALLTDAARRAELSRSGLHRAAQFSWRRTADETVRVYRRVLEGRGAGTASLRVGVL
jgi:glycosyltransferase involved in cell wall biosynthesis